MATATLAQPDKVKSSEKLLHTLLRNCWCLQELCLDVSNMLRKPELLEAILEADCKELSEPIDHEREIAIRKAADAQLEREKQEQT